MSFLRRLFSPKAEPINSYTDFWNWFLKHEKAFYKVIKKGGDIEKDFFEKLSPKLNELKEGFFFLTGMLDDTTAELVITADGTIKNIVFVEELIAAAPAITGWKFTALKPAMPITDATINMGDLTFSNKNLHFYPNYFPEYPDEIDITVVHDDYTEENKADITTGTYIFLDNFLGELNSATTIDNLIVAGREETVEELIPIAKLKDYLIWRQKEFVEKYEGMRHDTEIDEYGGYEGHLENDKPLIAVLNTELLEWDSKASHPWILTIEIPYDGTQNNGLPDDDTFRLLDKIEDEVLLELKDYEGNLNLGRQTADGLREIYFACKDFRNPSKVAYALEQKYAGQLEISYDLYKDKYWQSFNRFRV